MSDPSAALIHGGFIPNTRKGEPWPKKIGSRICLCKGSRIKVLLPYFCQPGYRVSGRKTPGSALQEALRLDQYTYRINHLNE